MIVKRLLPVVILAIGIAGFVALRLTRPEPPPATAQERSWRIEVQRVRLGEQTPILPLFGELVAPQRVTLTASLPARIAERPVREGQRVAEGELLVALDEADIAPLLAQAAAEVADLEAQLANEQLRLASDRAALAREQEIRDNAARQLERARSLVERNLGSRADLDAAQDALARARLTLTTRENAIAEHPARRASLEARLARAQANLAATQRDAERARVIAPFAGIVSEVRVAPGERVASGATLLSVYPESGLELRARLPRQHEAELIEALARGETLLAEAENGARFTLAGFAGEGDASGSEAILALREAVPGLRPGSLLAVTLARPAHPRALALPFSALHGNDRLYRVEEGRLVRLEVERLGETLGAEGERLALVTGEALADGQRIMITHLPNAMQGLRVDVAESAEEPEA